MTIGRRPERAPSAGRMRAHEPASCRAQRPPRLWIDVDVRRGGSLDESSFDLAADELAVDSGLGAGLLYEVEPCARSIRDHDEDQVRTSLGDDLGCLVDRAQDRHPDAVAAAEPGIVVDKADHLLARRLAELAREASSTTPAPTTSTRRRGPDVVNGVTPRYAARSQKREAPIGERRARRR